MWPFRKESEEDKRKRELQEAGVAALERGELPPVALRRIEETRSRGQEFFTSDLSPREFLLCREAGITPISQVMGSCFYKVGYRGYYSGRYGGSGELSNLTHAQSEARRIAISRMEQEAQLLGASGVIGVTLHKRGYDWSSGLVEFTAIGTAIRVPGWGAEQGCFSSDLNGQEFWRLYRMGYRPRGIAFGICSYYVYTNPQAMSQMFNWWGGSTPNQEVDHYTQCFLNARYLSIKRFNADLQRLGADGGVGMVVDYDIEQFEYDDRTAYSDVLLNFVAVGTAIVKDEHAGVQPPAGALICYDLASGCERFLGGVTPNKIPDQMLAELPPELRRLIEQAET